MTRGSIEHKHTGKHYFWRCLISALRLMFKYRRYVLIATDIQNNQDEHNIRIVYCGLNPLGMKHTLGEFLESDNAADGTVEEAKKILREQ